MSTDAGAAGGSDIGTNPLYADCNINHNQPLSSPLEENEPIGLIENIPENLPSHILSKTCADTGAKSDSHNNMSPVIQDEGDNMNDGRMILNEAQDQNNSTFWADSRQNGDKPELQPTDNASTLATVQTNPSFDDIGRPMDGR
jgi:hypothetical protein